jgi:hypothetical protein
MPLCCEQTGKMVRIATHPHLYHAVEKTFRKHGQHLWPHPAVFDHRTDRNTSAILAQVDPQDYYFVRLNTLPFF